MPEVRILSFDPLEIELPAGDIVPAGEIRFVLPPARILIMHTQPPLPASARFAVNANVNCSLVLAEALPVAQLREFIRVHLNEFRTAHANVEAYHLQRPERALDNAAAVNALANAMIKSTGF